MSSSSIEDRDIATEEKDVGEKLEAPAAASDLHDIETAESPLPEHTEKHFKSDARSIRTITDELDNTVGIRKALSRTQSAAASLRDPGPPPDGGKLAWSQACTGHLVIFNTWGFINSFGVFQTYYTGALHAEPSSISWIGTTQVFLLFFIGTFSGRALDAGLFHHVFTAGAVLQLLGIFMTSLGTKYWHIFLSQGVCMGLGNGLQFCPTIGLVSTYFAKRRALGIAITACGSGTGGMVVPVIVQQLLPRVGFGWTLRILGFIVLLTNLVCIFSFRTRLPPRKSGPLVEWSAFKELTYILVCIGMFLIFWAMFFGFYYVGSYGRNVQGLTYSDSINLILILNGLGIPGRLIPNFLSDTYFGPLNSIIPYVFGAGVVLYSWSAVSSQGGTYAFAVFYGIFGAAVQGLFPATLASLTKDLQKAGVRLGMGFSIVSFASLTGAPLGGALIQMNHGNYLYAQMWAGTCMVLGSLTLAAARISLSGWKLKVKL